MKKTTFSKVILMLLAFTVMLAFAVVLSISANERSSAKTVEIISNNVYWGDTLKLMYAVKAENVTSDDSIAVKLYDESGNELETITDYVSQTVNGEDCYVFTSSRGIPAQNIGRVIFAKAEIIILCFVNSFDFPNQFLCEFDQR